MEFENTNNPEEQKMKEVDAGEELRGLDDGDDGEGGDVTYTAPSITLISKEGDHILLRKSAGIKLSGTIRSAFDNGLDCKEINMEHINSDILKLIATYLEYHEENTPGALPMPLPSSNLDTIIKDNFDLKFVKDNLASNQPNMFNMILAANYLEIPSLLHLSCATYASMLKGKTPQQIRETFGIKGTYDPSEEDEVRKKYAKFIDASGINQQPATQQPKQQEQETKTATTEA
jgi:S-phase kinase-associated protein 1